MKFGGVKLAGCSCVGPMQHAHDGGGDSVFPTCGELLARLSGVPVGLFDDVSRSRVAEDEAMRLHLFMVRSRRARTRPLRRISATLSSILGPLAAAARLASRSPSRRSLSCRISSRTYSLGVPQSPEATWPSTYSFRASGSEMFNEVMGMAS